MADGVGLVWAQSLDGVIGLDGAIPWHLPEDLAHFRSLTWGAVVMMGRRTWCSLPDAARPLPGRRCLVLSRQAGFVAAGAEVHGSLGSALASAGTDPVWVAGGERVYAEALPLASRVVVTDVDLQVGGGAGARLGRAPRLADEGADGGWRETERTPSEGWATSSTGLRYRIRDLTRRGGASATREPGARRPRRR